MKQDYINKLGTQIKTEKQRKKYDILMTEHERRIHDTTIKAYEAFKTDAIGSNGVPGIGQNFSAI